jgi:2-hydroxychromene-2-carboxylate isomerase
MSKHVHYFMTPVSPWTYLGHDRFVALCARHGATIDLDFAGAVMRARFVDERDIADPEALGRCAAAAGLDAATIAMRAAAPEIAARYEAFTQEAIDRQVFGAPWYVVDGEPFWGQDRLDFVGRKLAQ